MSYDRNRAATVAKLDPTHRPQPMAMLRVDMDFADFAQAAVRAASSIYLDGLSGIVTPHGYMILGAMIWVETEFLGGAVSAVSVDVGTGGEANEFVSNADITGVFNVYRGYWDTDRGTASSGRNPFVNGGLRVTLDCGAVNCDQLTQGELSVFLIVAEWELDDHAPSPATKTPAAASARAFVGAAPPVVTLITSADSPYSPTASDTHIEADATAGNVVINLPAVSTSRELVVGRDITDASGNTVTVNAFAGDVFAGVATDTLAAGEYLGLVVSRANTWSVM